MVVVHYILNRPYQIITVAVKDVTLVILVVLVAVVILHYSFIIDDMFDGTHICIVMCVVV